MKTRLPLCREQFSYTPCLLLESEDFSVELFRYPAGIEAIRIHNRRGTVIVLPFLGQMVWDVNFDGRALTMGHRFKQPLPGDSIIDTYGCFAFHSGLLANGCPAAEDTHALHGEMACARMDTAWIVLEGDRLSVEGETEYIKGFGHHYRAAPAVRLGASQARLLLEMSVTNLAGAPMPLQYMCHINSAWVAQGQFRQTIPDEAFAPLPTGTCAAHAAMDRFYCFPCRRSRRFTPVGSTRDVRSRDCLLCRSSGAVR
ncbi:hypothetical protein NB694_002375 [Pantoea ananatis]|nr:hypothetical protein [Pantoea ananatis]